MNEYEWHMHDRLSRIPEEIMLLARKNATIHAAIFAWAKGSDSVEVLLTKLVLVLAGNVNDLEAKLIDQLRKSPVG